MGKYKTTKLNAKCAISNKINKLNWELNCIGSDMFIAGHRSLLSTVASQFPDDVDVLTALNFAGQGEVEVWVDFPAVGPYSVQPKQNDIWIIDKDHPPRVESEE